MNGTGSLRQRSLDRQTAASRENGSALTLENAVRQALSWHPSIDEAVGRLNQQTAEIDSARSGYYPRIRGGVGAPYESSYGGGWRPRLNVSASQMIYDFGKVSSSVDAETAGANVSHAQLLLGVDTLVRDTANAVIEAQRYRALLGVARAQVDGVAAIATLARQRSSRGASTRSDLVQADARVEAARSTVSQIGAQLARWESILANFIGAAGPVHPVPSVPDWLSNACDVREPQWSQVPAMQQAEARRREALAQLDLSRAQRFPTVSLDASGGYYLTQRPESDSGGSLDRSEFTVGLNLSMDLYDGGLTEARRNAARHALRAADAAIKNARVTISRGLMEASSQTESLNSLLALLSTRGGMMEETRDLYRRQYVELGTRTLLDLLNAEQELHQSRFDTVNTVHDLRKLEMECVFNSGKSRELFGLEGMTIRGATLSR